MLEEVLVIVWVEERLDSICRTVDVLWGDLLETYFAESAKSFDSTVFCTSKLILISEASTNGI